MMKYDIPKIRELIRAKGMNEIAFLHSVGLGSMTLIRWNVGSEVPREEYLSYIANGLNVTIEDLETKKERKCFSYEEHFVDELVKNYEEDTGVITPDQVSEEDYLKWVEAVREIRKLGEILIDYYVDAEFSRRPEHVTIYHNLRIISQILGEINGEKLHFDDDICRTIIAYSWDCRRNNKISEKYNLNGADDIFRLKFEHLLARKVFLQKAKTKSMLADDQEDLYLRRKLRTSNKRNTEKKVKQKNNQNELTDGKSFYIPIERIILREGYFWKPKQEKIEKIYEYYKKHRTIDKPVVVSREGDYYVLEDKYLRYYVAKQLNLEKIPAQIIEKQEEKDAVQPLVSRTQVVEPSSTILTAKLCMQKSSENIDIIVVSDAHEQNTSEGIYWVGRVLPSTLLIAAKAKEKTIFYNGDSKVKKGHYEIVDFVAYSSAEKYAKIISRFSNAEAPQTVYVYSQKTVKKEILEQCEMVTAMIPCANRKLPIPVSVYYDNAKKQYFLNEVTYLQLRKSYGLPYLRIQTVPASATLCNSNLKAQSELNLLGYNVNTTEALPIEERRKILCDAIDSGVLWKSEVVNHLEWLIKMGERNPLMENAVGEWKEDLMYISHYKSEEQRKVWINKFKSGFSEKVL